MTKTRYERTHPVLSIRVSQELYDEIQDQRRNGQSYGDILRIGLGRQQAAIQPLLKTIEELNIEALKLEAELDKYRS